MDDTGMMNMSLDEMRAQFESFKLACAQQFEQHQKLIKEFQMEAELQGVRQELNQLHEVMRQLEEIKPLAQCCAGDVSAIETLDSISFVEVRQFDWELQEQQKQLQKEKEQPQQQLEQQLVISCGVSPCLFEDCGRQIDSQLLLLHYLTDHGEENAAFQHCHRLLEGQHATLSLETRLCQFQRNHVIGLLAYGGSLVQEKPLLPTVQRRIYNSFLPKQHAHLECDVPVVVLICKTAANATEQACPLQQPHENLKSQIFVIWLVTPHAHLEIHAKLTLCGRNPAEQASAIVTVRQVSHSQNTAQFMAVDGNYWCVPHEEMRRISNGFRDELQLELSLTHRSKSHLD